MNPVYSFSNPRRQVSLVPYGFTNYIFKNYTSKAYVNMMKTCKDFFGSKRIIVVDKIEREYGRYYAEVLNEKVELDLPKFKDNKIQLWITTCIDIGIFHDVTRASDLVKYIYRFDGKLLFLAFQELDIKEYMKLVNSNDLESVYLLCVNVKMMDGSFASAEILLKPLLNVKVLQ